MITPHIIRVIGMPRSGTAFASMLLALHPDCVSYHELAADDKNWKMTITENESDYVADCNTYGFLEEAVIPHTVLIYLDRNPVASLESTLKATHHKLELRQFEQLHQRLTKWALDNDAFVMNEGEVFSLDGMLKLWVTAFGSHVEFPHYKVEQLEKLNIQHKNPQIVFGKDGGFEL